MRLSVRTLNRTLWVRQHLVPSMPPAAMPITDAVVMTHHLIGLQAQENLPPYLSLSARIPDFDPLTLSDAIAERRLVRMLTMRGTVHVLTPGDALALRPWVQPALDRVSMSNQVSRPARDVPSADLIEAATTALADGPMPVADLGAYLHARFPDAPPGALRNAARERVPMLQVPPRGLWRQSGGVVYELATSWLGRPMQEIDVPELVRRYLRAFGPASPADMTKWSSVTGLGPVFKSMLDELVVHETVDGKPHFDVPEGVIVDADLQLPTVVLGNYDNLWLSHADRSRIAAKDKLAGWMGRNGGFGAGVFVDGMLEGCWRDAPADGGRELTAFRRLTKAERAGVDAEIDRVRALVGR